QATNHCSSAHMSSPHSPDPRGGTGQPGTPSSGIAMGLLSRSSARFGALSHHSFFSRHNPHPSRVRHIQGLNGRPVCTVRDDWFVTSSLFPHPLLKGNVFPRGRDLSLPFAHNPYASSLLSERWQDELKELADQTEEEPIRRKTQYSSQTGRIIPPSSKSYQRRSYSRSQPAAHPQILHHQELMVLEMLCQILQTDSLSNVQQWLLLAGQRGKKYVWSFLINVTHSALYSISYLEARFSLNSFCICTWSICICIFWLEKVYTPATPRSLGLFVLWFVPLDLGGQNFRAPTWKFQLERAPTP
uniref:Thymus, brain and testes associated n=1 Tax=Neogobius melanostomus TaxID=47308 RepID=A0A8C6TN59_9GOBI